MTDARSAIVAGIERCEAELGPVTAEDLAVVLGTRFSLEADAARRAVLQELFDELDERVGPLTRDDLADALDGRAEELGEDRYVCEAGHNCGTEAPDGLTCHCGAAVWFAMSARDISHQLRLLLENWDYYADAVWPAARPAAITELGNALFHLRPWLARMATVLGGDGGGV